MTTTIKAKPKAPLRVRLIDAAILIITLGLGALAFLTLLDPMINIGAVWVSQNIEGTIHQVYNMTVIYNVWLFIGGGITLAFIIGSIEYYPKRFGESKIRRWLLITCVVEGILIALNLAVANLAL